MEILKSKKFNDKLIRLILLKKTIICLFKIKNQFNSQEAEQFLHDRTLTIRRQNIELRKRLQDILKRQQNLNELKQSLEEDQLHLIRRLKLVADLRKIRLDKVSSDITNKSSKSKLHQ